MALALLPVVFLSGCVIHPGSELPSQLDIEVQNATKVKIDQKIEQSSAALHQFLVGQLAYTKEDFDKALSSFTKASELVVEPEPHLHARLAELHLRSGDFEEALKETDRALVESQNIIYLKYFRAGLLEALSRFDEAGQAYADIVSDDQTALDAYVFLSGVRFRLGDLEGARDVLLRAQKSLNKESLVHYHLGLIYEQRGELEPAALQVKEAVVLDPANTTFRYDLTRLYTKLNDIKHARAEIALALKAEPSNALVARISQQLGSESADDHQAALSALEKLRNFEMDSTAVRYRLALLKIEKQNFPDAIRDLNLVLAIKPDHQEARYYLASVYAGAGRQKEAVEELFKIESGDEMFVKSRTLAAFLLRHTGDLKRAEKAVRQALQVEPGNRKLLAYLVQVLRDAKKYSEAEKTLAKAIAENPDDERLIFQHGIILNDLKRNEDSLKAMEQVLALNPSHPEALNYVAYSLAEQGRDLVRAQALIEKALEQDVNDGYYLDTLGWIYYRKEDYKKAEEILTRAVNIVPDDVSILEHLADALMKLGKKEKALEVYRTALEKGQDLANPEDREDLSRIEQKLEQLKKEVNTQSLLPQPPGSGVRSISQGSGRV